MKVLKLLVALCLAAVACSQDYSNNDYSQNDYAQNDYAQNDYAQNDYAQNDYAQNEYSQNDYTEDYQDYADSYDQQDNLYEKYADRQKDSGRSDAAAGGGVGMGKLFAGCAFSWVVGGKFHSSRTAKKLKAKFQKEQKQLYSQYYNDVYKLTEQTGELQFMVEQLQDALQQTEAKHELEALQRDYEEFKQPDIDGDDKISRAEFNMYVKNYLSNYPGLSEKDYPKFEDFDHDGDGTVTFQEYTQQMALQAQKAEREMMYGDQSTRSAAQGLNDLVHDAKKANDFNDMYQKMLS